MIPRNRSSHARSVLGPLLLAMVLVVGACTSSEPGGDTGGGDGATTTEASGPGDTTGTTEEPGGAAMTSAERAVEAANAECSGTTLDVMWEAGLQPLDPNRFSIPLWNELVPDVSINLLEVPNVEQLPTVLADHLAGADSFDVISLGPNNLPDAVQAGLLVPLDDYVADYMVPEDLDDFHPLYQGLGEYDGQIYGLYDDGDVEILYYRKDVFDDPDLQAAFMEEFGRPLEVPATIDDLATVAQFITDQRAPEMYGYGDIRLNRNDRWFLTSLRVNGGELFDVDNDMRALINSEVGLQTVNQMLAQMAASPPGIESWGGGEAFNAFLTGQIAMTFFWPPLGRWAAKYGTDLEELSFLPESQVADVTGYAVMAGGHAQHAGAFNLSVSVDSDSPDCAYYFIQWLTSPDVSLQRVTLPYAFRDPYRLSHFSSDEYRSLWPTAGEYLDTLELAADTALIDPSIPGATEYGVALDQALTSIWAGGDPQEELDNAAEEWNRITDRIGVDAQRAAWELFITQPGSLVETTVDALGLTD